MSLPDLHQKITVAEAIAWIHAVVVKATGVDNREALTDEILVECRPKDFKYRKPRVSKKSSASDSERSQDDYNEDLCDARVWVGGYGGQCSRKKSPGCLCCKTHQKAVDEFGLPKEGYITGERPDYHYNDESKPFIPWKDSSVEKPTRSRSASSKSRKPTKCSICGELGHNKRKCPENSDNADKELSICKPCTDADSVSSITESVASLTVSEQGAAGVGFTESLPEPEPQPEPQPPSESDLEDDSDNMVDCSLEGIEYVYEKDTSIVRDEDFDQVGTWDGEKIVFDKSSLKMHAMKVAAL